MDPEIDPEIAAQMGFASFGVQHNRKRKHRADESPVANPQSGANATLIGSTQTSPKQNDGPEPTQRHHESSEDGQSDLQSLRRGMRNEKGDMAYFLPSFLEDPWKALLSQES